MTSNRFENNQAEPTRAAEPRRVTPAVDIFENAAGFVILADLPGVETNELSVEFNPPELRVSARPQNAPFVYERRFELGSGVDPTSTSAELKDGVLRIELKKSEALRPRRIEVRAA
jgi:HSP20 family molecular chaperone IbpA